MSIKEIINVIDWLATGAEECSRDIGYTKKRQTAHRKRARALREAIDLLRTHPEAQPNEPLTLEELQEYESPYRGSLPTSIEGGLI